MQKKKKKTKMMIVREGNKPDRGKGSVVGTLGLFDTKLQLQSTKQQLFLII
jgi:hypothetical protein